MHTKLFHARNPAGTPVYLTNVLVKRGIRELVDGTLSKTAVCGAFSHFSKAFFTVLHWFRVLLSKQT